MREQPKFIPQHQEYEKLAEIIKPERLQEYQTRELEKQQNYNQHQIVYEYCESSPFYNYKPIQEQSQPQTIAPPQFTSEAYICEKEEIDLPPLDQAQ